MNINEQRRRERIENDRKAERVYRRNWIIAIIAIALAFLAANTNFEEIFRNFG